MILAKNIEIFVHYSGNDMAKIMPVCLAIVPDMVTTTILDLPPNFHGDTSYIFKTPEGGQKAFNLVKETIQSVADNLPEKSEFEKTSVSDFPKFVHDMTSVQIFLKTVLLMAAYRKEMVDYDKMRNKVQEVKQTFSQVDKFNVIPSLPKVRPLIHHYANKMPHPFICQRS